MIVYPLGQQINGDVALIDLPEDLIVDQGEAQLEAQQALLGDPLDPQANLLHSVFRVLGSERKEFTLIALAVSLLDLPLLDGDLERVLLLLGPLIFVGEHDL